MIGNKKSTPSMHSSTDAVNRIVEGTTFEGNIRSESNMWIDGTFEGDIATKGRIVVGPKGIIKGNVTCNHCEVEGVMEGQIEVKELMALKSSAKVAGQVYYGQLSGSGRTACGHVSHGPSRSQGAHDGQARCGQHPQGC